MKKILLSCVTCLLALGLVTACDDEVEDVTPNEPETTIPSTGDDSGGDDGGSSTPFYVLGVEVGSTLNYITGETPSGYAYEGTLTTDISKAVPVTYEQGSDNEYYVSFELEKVSYWVTIIETEGTDKDGEPATYVNLSYATKKSALYLHTTDAGAEYLGNEDGSYFLCYYSKYSCLYASAISYLETSPVAGIYSNDGTLLLGGKSPVTAPEVGNPEGEHIHDVVVTSPDDKGVYVLGYETEDGDVYLTYGSGLGSTKAYSSAVSVRTLAVEGGYNLQLGDGKYLGANEGALAVVESATAVAVDSGTGAITCSGLTLTVDEEGAFVWAESPETVVVLFDVAYDHDVAAIEDSTNLVLGIIVDGTYEYITGETTMYTNRGTLSSDISKAVAISLTANEAADNAYEMTFVDSDGATRWITIRAVTSSADGASTDTTGFQYETEEALIYWDETHGYWTNEDGTYYLSLWSSYSCLGVGTVGSTYASAILYYNSTVPALRGVAIEDTDEAVPLGGTLQLGIKLYPTCLEDTSSLVWSADSTYVTVENGVVSGVAIADSTEVSVSAEGLFGDSILLAVAMVPITTTITYETIMGLEQFSNKTWSTSDQTCFSSTEGVVTAFGGCTVTWYTDSSGSSNGCAIYKAGDLRIYKYAHFDIIAAEGYEITSTEVYTSSNGDNLTCTNGSNTVWANYTYTTGGPSDGSGPIVYKNGYAGQKNVVIGYITIVATPVSD